MSNVPDVVRPEPTRAVERVADTDSWIGVMQYVIPLAERIAGTEFVPKSLRNSPAAVAAAVLYGREVGLPPMTSLTQTHVIEGKPAMSAEAMRAMVLAAGHELIVEETTGAVCSMRARRTGSEHWTSLTWTIDMARAAGVAGKQVWKSYPRQMLQARCTTELVRLVFPDVIHGFRSVEELEDHGEVEVTAAAAPAEAPTKVTRKRTTTKKAATPAAIQPPAAPPAEQSVPLPGEDGYDDLTGTSAPAGNGGESPGSDDRPTDSQSGGTGQDDEDPGDSNNDGQDVVDGVIVEETADTTPPPDAEEPAPGPRMASRAQLRLLFAALGEKDVSDPERHVVVGALIRRDIDSFNELTMPECKALIDTLARCRTRSDVDALIEAAEQAEADS